MKKHKNGTDMYQFPSITESFDLLTSSSVISDEHDDLINNQTKIVEEYLNNPKRKQKDSDTYRLIKSLFTLFKSEVQLNISLRKAYARERENRFRTDKETVSMYQFFKEISRITGHDICNFEEVCDSFIKLKQKSIEQKNNLNKKYDIYAHENAKIGSRLEMLQSQYDEAKMQIYTDEVNIKNMSCKIKTINELVKKLKKDLNNANQVIENQKKTIDDLSLQNKDFSKPKDNMCDTNNLTDEKDYIIKTQEQHYKKLLEMKEQELLNVSNKLTQKDLQLKEFEQKLLDFDQKLTSKNSINLQEKELIKQKAENEINAITEKYNALNSELCSIKSKVMDTEKENIRLSEENRQHIELTERVIRKLDKQKTKMKTLKKAVQQSLIEKNKQFEEEMDSALVNQRKEFEKRIADANTATEQNAMKINELEVELDAKIQEKESLYESLSSKERKLSELRLMIDDIKTENERLRDKMRSQTAFLAENEQCFHAFRKIAHVLNAEGIEPFQVVSLVEDLIADL